MLIQTRCLLILASSVVAVALPVTSETFRDISKFIAKSPTSAGSLSQALTPPNSCSFDGRLGVCVATCPAVSPQKSSLCPNPSDVCCIQASPPTPPGPPPTPPGPAVPSTPPPKAPRGVPPRGTPFCNAGGLDAEKRAVYTCTQGASSKNIERLRVSYGVAASHLDQLAPDQSTSLYAIARRKKNPIYPLRFTWIEGYLTNLAPQDEKPPELRIYVNKSSSEPQETITRWFGHGAGTTEPRRDIRQFTNSQGVGSGYFAYSAKTTDCCTPGSFVHVSLDGGETRYRLWVPPIGSSSGQGDSSAADTRDTRSSEAGSAAAAQRWEDSMLVIGDPCDRGSYDCAVTGAEKVRCKMEQWLAKSRGKIGPAVIVGDVAYDTTDNTKLESFFDSTVGYMARAHSQLLAVVATPGNHDYCAACAQQDGVHAATWVQLFFGQDRYLDFWERESGCIVDDYMRLVTASPLSVGSYVIGRHMMIVGDNYSPPHDKTSPSWWKPQWFPLGANYFPAVMGDDARGYDAYPKGYGNVDLNQHIVAPMRAVATYFSRSSAAGSGAPPAHSWVFGAHFNGQIDAVAPMLRKVGGVAAATPVLAVVGHDHKNRLDAPVDLGGPAQECHASANGYHTKPGDQTTDSWGPSLVAQPSIAGAGTAHEVAHLPQCLPLSGITTPGLGDRCDMTKL